MATAAATTASASATTADINLDEILAVATESAKAAGAIIAESFDRKDEFDVYSKGGVDMVTTVDKVQTECHYSVCLLWFVSLTR